ncbi:MAG: hypothetical protein AAGK22_09475 [Acidobacteriota bacterium]
MPSDDSKAPPDAPRPLELAPTLDGLHRAFLKTRDPRYLVLAIGLCPQAPPLWATSACARLAADPSYRGGAVRRSTGSFDADERLLDELFTPLAEGRTPAAAVRRTISQALATHAQRREPRLDPIREGQRLSDPVGSPRTLQDAYELALREIESGDLATELDEEEEHTRQSLSQWVLVDSPDSGGDASPGESPGFLVRLAPRPRGRNLVRMVKAQLLALRDRDLGAPAREPRPTAALDSGKESAVPLAATVRAAASPPSSDEPGQ